MTALKTAGRVSAVDQFSRLGKHVIKPVARPRRDIGVQQEQHGLIVRRVGDKLNDLAVAGDLPGFVGVPDAVVDALAIEAIYRYG